MRPGLSVRAGSKARLMRAVSACVAASSGGKTSSVAPAPLRINVAWPWRSRAAAWMTVACGLSVKASQRIPPAASANHEVGLRRVIVRCASVGGTEMRQSVVAGSNSGWMSAASRKSFFPTSLSSGRARGAMRAREFGGAGGDAFAVTFEADEGDGARDGYVGGGACWEMDEAGRFERRARDGPHHLERVGGVLVLDGENRRVAARDGAQREFGHREERAEGAGGEFRQVVAGDVLDDAAAGFEAFAFAVDGGEAQQVIARGAGGEAARAATPAATTPPMLAPGRRSTVCRCRRVRSRGIGLWRRALLRSRRAACRRGR